MILRMMAPEGYCRARSFCLALSVKKSAIRLWKRVAFRGEKGAALPSNSTDLLWRRFCERVQQAMRSAPPLLSPCQLDRLSGLVHQRNDLPAIDILIDEIKACLKMSAFTRNGWNKKDKNFALCSSIPICTKATVQATCTSTKYTQRTCCDTEAGDPAPMGLLDELQRFLQSINAQYKRHATRKRRNRKWILSIPCTQLCHKLDMLYADGERIDFLSELDEHILSVDPVVFYRTDDECAYECSDARQKGPYLQISEEGVISIKRSKS